MLVGMFWNQPENYDSYDNSKINKSTFSNGVWGFYFGLGRYIYEEKGLKVFDDIAVYESVKSIGMTTQFEKAGGYETVEELILESKDSMENLEGYYKEVKKYQVLREYFNLFGEKVLEEGEVYNYKKLTSQQIMYYWQDKINNIDLELNETEIVAYNLLDNLDDFLVDLKENAGAGMPLYKARRYTEISSGWARGTITILSAFSGNGKSSLAVALYVMACIENEEKLLIIANEMDIRQYQKILFSTYMSNELYEDFKDVYENPRFNRKAFNRGEFTDDEWSKIEATKSRIEERIKGKENLVKFVPLQDYTMENVKMTMKKYKRRGYHYAIIDTAKPSESGNKERWEQFVEDFDELYKMARKDAGGLDMGILTTVQQADNMVNSYWLNEMVIADGKKIKNVADVVHHMRPVFRSEYKEGEKELKVYDWRPVEEDDFNQDESQYEESFRAKDGTLIVKKNIELKDGNVYYLLFTSKNRRGGSNLTGTDVLVYKVDFNGNRWVEIGWATNVHRDDN